MRVSWTTIENFAKNTISERELQSYVPCEEAALSSELPDYEDLSPEQRRYAHERYTLIAGVIPFLGDKTFMCETIERIASWTIHADRTND